MLHVVGIVGWADLFGGAPAAECLGEGEVVGQAVAEVEALVDLAAEVLVAAELEVNGKKLYLIKKILSIS